MKKFLSLVLALVMTMSLVTISAGAKDFTDADKVNYDEAIAVLSAVKVIDGYTDGSFKPQTQLNRGQAAKIICNLILGPTTAAELHATAAPFSDVPADNIFAGYITYCANKGIIGGYGDGTFRPTGSLTGYAFMKMLLGALGYDANIEGYNIPGSWSIQVAKQAIGIGLNKGLKDTFDGTKPVTREEACLYALNTLQADLVEYGSKTNITVGGSAVVIGDSEAKAQKWNNSITKIENIKKDGYIQFAEQYFPKLELEIGNGIYGRPANTWKLKKAEIGTFTSIEPTKVYTKGTDGDDVYKDLGKVVCDEKEYDWTAFVNGEEVAAKDVKVPAKVDKEYAYTGEGTVTEIYVDDDAQTVTVCEINYYLGQVSKVKKDDDGEYITVKVLSNGAKLDNKTFYVDGYAEDDYVVFTVDYNDDKDFVIGEVCEPETVTAEVTRVDEDKDTGATYLKANGEKYVYAEDEKDPAQQSHIVYDLDNVNVLAHPKLNEDYILYLDPNGYVLGFELADEEEVKYLYVLDSDEHLSTWEAKVLLADGTVAKVEVKDEIKKLDADKNGKNDKITWNEEGNYQHSVKKGTNIDHKIFSYTVSDKGVYTLTNIADQGYKKPVEIHNGKAYVSVGVNDYIVDKKTTFVDYDGEKAYTGYNEVPNVENAEIAYVLDGKVAEIVFILDGDIYDKDGTYFVLTKDTRESLKYDDEHYWEYSKAYVKGEKKNVIVAYDALVGGVEGVKLDAGKLYKATKTIDEQYIIELKHIAWEGNTVNAVGDDAFWLTTVKSKTVKYDTNDETEFVLVEETVDEEGKSTWTVSEGNINDLKAPKNDDKTTYTLTAQVLEKDDETAELVYIYLKAVDKKANVPGNVVVPEGEFAPATYNKTTREIELRYYGDEMTDAEIKKAIEDLVGEPVVRLNRFNDTAVLESGDIYNVNFTQIEQVALKVDGEIVAYADKSDNGKINVPGAKDPKYLLENKVGTRLLKGINISADADHNLYTAYQVTLASNVTAALNDKNKTQVFDNNYVAAGEKLVLTFPKACEGKDYTISVGGEVVKTIVKAVENQTVTVTVDGAVKVAEVKYMTAAEIEKEVATNYTAPEHPSGCRLAVKDKTVTLTIGADTDLSNVGDTGLLVLAGKLITEDGNEITVACPNGSMTLNQSNIVDHPKTALINLLGLQGNNPAAGASVKITVTVTNPASGEFVDYTVVLARTEAEA